MLRAPETSGRIVICLTSSFDKTAREETPTRGSVASARWGLSRRSRRFEPRYQINHGRAAIIIRQCDSERNVLAGTRRSYDEEVVRDRCLTMRKNDDAGLRARSYFTHLLSQASKPDRPIVSITVQLQEGWQAKLTIGYLLVDAMCRGEYVPVGDEHTPAVLNRALSEKSCHPWPLFGIGRSTARDPRLCFGGGAASSGSSWFPRRLFGDRRVRFVPPNQFVRYILLLLGT